MDDSVTDIDVDGGQIADIQSAICGGGDLPKFALASCRKAGRTYVAGYFNKLADVEAHHVGYLDDATGEWFPMHPVGHGECLWSSDN
jgi:hypothetical protein